MQAAFCLKRYIVFGFSVSHISAPNVMLFVEVVQVFMVNAECCLFLDRFVTKNCLKMPWRVNRENLETVLVKVSVKVHQT
jgi:hypothetical protein